MNRNDFIKSFQEYYNTTEINYLFTVDVNELNEGEIGAKEYLKPFLSYLKLNDNTKNNILSNTTIRVDFDWGYSEGDEEEDYDENICRFQCKINLHQFYDQFVLQNNFNLPVTTIYRIENNNKKGLYDCFFAAIKGCPINQPSPLDDQAFNGIFEEDNRLDINLSNYKRTWYFSFSSLNDVKAWLLEDSNAEKLKEKEFFINKITIPSSFVIEGNKQTIFQKAHIAFEQKLDLSILSFSSDNTSSFRLNR